MARISRQTREIINIVIFLLIVGVLLTTFVIYPLMKTKLIMARANLDDYNSDSLVTNDATMFVEAGLVVDTFRIESDGLTNLACLYASPADSVIDSIKGTVFLLHDNGETRDSLLETTRQLIAAGFAVVAYDQRASGRSTGKYRGDGFYEGEDLSALIAYLNLREKITPPVIAAGFSLGGEAVLLAAQLDDRIKAVIAIEPYLTTHRMLDIQKEAHDVYWLPFYRSLMWFWYDIRSGYAAIYRDIDKIKAVTCRTILVTTETDGDNEALDRLVELSDPNRLTLEKGTITKDQLAERIIQLSETDL